MLTTPHVLLGAVLITKLPLPLGIPATLLSHFALDFIIPHWNPHLFTEMKAKGKISQNSIMVILIDGTISALFIGYFALMGYSLLLLALGAFLATLPDWIEIPFYFLKVKHPLLVKYVTFEHNHQAKANPFWGIFTQLTIIIFSLWMLVN